MKDVVRKEGDQKEPLHGVGFVPENVVGLPLGDQFVEARIFDIPSLVTETYGSRGGSLRG